MEAHRQRAGERGAETAVAADHHGSIRRLRNKRGRRQVVQVQNQIARVGTVTAGENEISHAGSCRQVDLGSHAAGVVVARHFCQRIARTGVEGEAGVKVAAKRVHDEQPADRRGELIPDAMAEAVHAIGNRITKRAGLERGLDVGVAGVADEDGTAAQIIRNRVNDLERHVRAAGRAVDVGDETTELAAGVGQLCVVERVTEIGRTGNDRTVAFPEVTQRIGAAGSHTESCRIAEQHNLARSLRKD